MLMSNNDAYGEVELEKYLKLLDNKTLDVFLYKLSKVHLDMSENHPQWDEFCAWRTATLREIESRKEIKTFDFGDLLNQSIHQTKQEVK